MMWKVSKVNTLGIPKTPTLMRDVVLTQNSICYN